MLVALSQPSLPPSIAPNGHVLVAKKKKVTCLFFHASRISQLARAGQFTSHRHTPRVKSRRCFFRAVLAASPEKLLSSHQSVPL